MRLPCSSSRARTRPDVYRRRRRRRRAACRSGRARWRPGRGPCPAPPRRSCRPPARFGLAFELLDVRDEQDRLEQVVDALAGLRADGHERHVAAVLLDDDAALGELRLDAVRLGVGQVDLVERDDDRHLAARAWSIASTVWGMTPSSAATTSTAISVTRAPRARIAVKASWPGVSRKTMRRPSVLDLAGADVLGDAAALAGRHRRRADGVEQARLAVVDVAHDGDDRARARRGVGRPRREQDVLGGPAGGLLAASDCRDAAARARRPGSRAPRSPGRPCHGRWSG